MKHKTLAIAIAVLLVLSMAAPALASPPYPEGDEPAVVQPEGVKPFDPRPVKPFDWPNPKDYQRVQERMRLLEAGKVAEANALATTGEDRVLVILVEFAGQDEFVWQAPTVPYSYTTGSMWDPLGIADPTEYTGEVGDCTNILQKIADAKGLTITDTWGMTFTFNYEGPQHNMIMRPISTTDRSGDTIWTDDFDKDWFTDFMFGNGVEISYTFQSSETMYASFLGQSVKDYYTDMSSGMYTITGDVIDWLGLPHSTWYYDADQCPGARSGVRTSRGAIPGAGDAQQLVRDALDAVNAISDTIPGFDWANYDQDGDGIIDRLWIVHAGLGEEDSTTLLNRNPVTGTARTTEYPAAFYGEAAVWSHSASVTPPYSVTEDIAAGPYIIMPENGGIGVFAHEYGHNLGAIDLYAYGPGDTSAGFWTLMADDWTGHPIGFEPPAVDPYHLDQYWGWLTPSMVITDTAQVYQFTLGQASRFETSGGDYRGAKIELPDGVLKLPASVWQGSYYWWGGKQDLANAMMTTVDPIAVTAGMTLSFDLAYDIEDGGWDFLWVQVSEDGVTWPYSYTLTNANTKCATDPSWIGGLYGFPDDLCAAGIGGFYGHNAAWPAPETQVFDLSDFAGKNVYLRLWYMTDWATTGAGPFVDNIEAGAFSDDAESGDAKWTYQAPWQRSNGEMEFSHNIYLQWRNVDPATGGYDSALGEEQWRFGPANSGLLVWYNNNFYKDNEIYNYLEDQFSFGPKGAALVIDAHPEPYINPFKTPSWLGKEHTNLPTRGLMRDATFSLWDSVDFTYTFPYESYVTPTLYTGRPAVPSFHDALGYYPGVADAGDGTYWSTVDWDSSAVVPAQDSYSVRGGPDYPGYHIQYISEYGGWYGFWGWDEGGTGNPRDDNVQYGWHVEILDQTNMTATVKVWNSAVHKKVGPAPPDITQPGDYTFTYTVSLHNAGGLDPVTGTVTMTIPGDLNIVDFSPSQPDGTLLLPPPPGTPQLPYRVVWEDVRLDYCNWITFTVVATTTVKAGDPPKLWEASVDVFDGSTWPPEHDEWTTRASVWGVEAAAVGPAAKEADAGTTVTYTARITNTGYSTDSFEVAVTTAPASWTTTVVPTDTGDLAAGEYADVVVSVYVAETAADGDTGETTLLATSANDPLTYDGVSFTTTALVENLIYLPLVMKNF